MSKKSFKRSNRQKQSRNMTVMCYCPDSYIKEVLLHHDKDIRAYAYIYHDKFSKEELGDKERKEPHYHIVLRLNRPFTESAVEKWFVCYNDEGLKQRVDVILTDDPFESYDYLIHKHSPDKYQFSLSDVVCNNSKAFSRLGDKSSDDNAINCLNDLLNGSSIYDVCTRYGRDIIYHMPQIKLCFDMIYYGKEVWELKDKGLILNRTMQEVNRIYTNED